MSSCPADLSVRVTCVLALAFFVAPLCFGRQQADGDRNRSTLSGVVRDQNKAVVAGAKVSISYAGLATLVTDSDENGAYSFVGIVAGKIGRAHV